MSMMMTSPRRSLGNIRLLRHSTKRSAFAVEHRASDNPAAETDRTDGGEILAPVPREPLDAAEDSPAACSVSFDDVPAAMKGSLHAGNVDASGAPPQAVELGGGRWPRSLTWCHPLGLGRDAAGLALQPHPALHAGDTNIEPLANFRIAAFAGEIGANHSLPQSKRVRFGHALGRSESDLRGYDLGQLG